MDKILTTKPRILFVEDNINLGFLTKEFLENEGFEISIHRDGEAGWRSFDEGSYDLCLLDCMLPKMDGFELAAKIREKKPNMPVIFLTAKTQKDDKGKGFNLGADDYITKPFDEDELLWRIKAILKRANQPETGQATANSEEWPLGEYVFEPANQVLKWNKTVQRLTERETQVLSELYKNMGNIVRREHLLNSIWGEADYFTGRSLDVFITKLRRYLQYDASVSIENIPRVGFRLKC